VCEVTCGDIDVTQSTGITGTPEDILRRIDSFGSNVIPPKPPKRFLQLVWEALQDVTLVILIVAAIISLGLSFYHAPPSGEDGKRLQIIIISELDATAIGIM